MRLFLKICLHKKLEYKIYAYISYTSNISFLLLRQRNYSTPVSFFEETKSKTPRKLVRNMSRELYDPKLCTNCFSSKINVLLKQ